MENEDNKIFAKGLCLDKLFWVFIVGSVFGVYYEEIMYTIKKLYSTGMFYFTLRRGVLYGPFNPLYGAGAVLMTYALLYKPMSTKKKFLISCFIGGGLEYIISLLQEIITHQISWDYSNHFLNINGRTTIPFMVVWGILGILFSDFLYPKLSYLIEKIPYRMGKRLTTLMIYFMILNCLISWGAIIRQGNRNRDIDTIPIVDDFFDKYYPDDYLEYHFPNMKFK